MRPDSTDDALRFRVFPDSSPHTEMLTLSFPVVTRVGATLAFQWAETLVPIQVEIISTRPAIVAAHPWASYAGVYEFRYASEPTAPAVRYEVIVRGAGLWVRTTVDAVEPGLDTEFDLLPAGGDDFHPRQYKNGIVIGDELDEVITFQFEGGRATGFEVRGKAEEKVLGRARRSAAR